MSEPLKDKLGRLFDRLKFKPEFDAIGRWKNANAGRKKGQTLTNKTPAPKRPNPSPMSTPTDETPANETPPVETTAASASGDSAAQSETLNPAKSADPLAPNFNDLADVLKAPLPSTEEAHNFDVKKAIEGTPTAETIIGILQTALVLIGEEEGILSETEKMLLRPPLERVLKKYAIGADVLPPEIDLAVCVAGLVITRLQKPKTARFAAKVRGWVVNLWFGHKGRQISRVVREEAAQ